MSNISQAAPQISSLQIRSLNLRYLATFLLFAATLAMAQTTPIVQNDFEDGTLQGWIPRGTATLSNTTESSHGGTHSLKTTGRTAGFNGPSLNVLNTLSQGNIYQITAWVRLVSGQTPDQLKITVQRTPASNPFEQVTPLTNVTDAAWVMLQGTYSFTGDVSGLLLYIEAAGANTQYYVDDFSIIQVPAHGCSVPQDNSGIHTDFETGTAQGWSGHFLGNGSVTPTNADAHSGSFSLLTTGRPANFAGPGINAAGKLCNGSRYIVSVWVKMAPGQPDTHIRVSLQRSLNGQTNFNTVIPPPNAAVTANAWVRLKGTYDFAFNYDSLSLYVEGDTTASFYIDDFNVTFVPQPPIENIPSIAQTYSSDFPVGFAAVQSDLVGSHGQLAALHYNSITPGNDLKWDTTEPSENSFNFGPADNILAFAQAHNIKMRGHTFVWHNQVPNWVFQDANRVDMSTQPFSAANKALLLSRLQNHIKHLIDHYQDKIYVWDVVNEAIDEGQTDGFRRTKWYAITVDPNNNPGYPEYMDDAFIYADAELKALGIRDKVKLCYNDFNTTIPAKRNFIFNWMKGAISRGVPIDCVGHQFHNTINFPINDQGSLRSKQNVIDTINLFSTLTSTAGVPIINEVTEFDISVYRFGVCSQTFYTDAEDDPDGDLLAGDQADLINQGYRYRDYFQIFKNLKDKIDSVTVWGLGDDHSWLNPAGNTANCQITAHNAPLPFDVHLQHKFAYTGMVDPLALPGANLVTTMTADPSPVPSGHLVSYLITVTNKGPNDAANLALTMSIPSVSVFSSVFQSVVAPAGWSCTTSVVNGAGTLSCNASALSNGDSAQFTFTNTVVCATPNGTTVPSSATVTSTTLNPNPNPQTSASLSITVSNPPPVISNLSVTPSVIWPPNHNMVDATLTYNITDNCDVGLLPKIAITSNEPLNGAGDGNTSADFKVLDLHHVQVRAERSGTGTGRVYTITLTATDSEGSSTSSSTTLTVPHDQ